MKKFNPKDYMEQDDDYPDPDELEYQEKVKASKRKNAKIAKYDNDKLKSCDLDKDTKHEKNI
jgi:hypothetical protein